MQQRPPHSRGGGAAPHPPPPPQFVQSAQNQNQNRIDPHVVDHAKEEGCQHVPPNRKRQRIASPMAPPPGGAPHDPSNEHHAANNDGHASSSRERTHVMPMFLCIPMLLLATCFIPGASAAAGSASTVDARATNTAGIHIPGHKKVYRPNRPVAPSRPGDAPDVDYGGVHPFDKHRHLYDAHFAFRQKSKQSGLRWLKEDKDKDKNKDKDKDKDKEEEEEEAVKATRRPTREPTDPPVTKRPEVPMERPEIRPEIPNNNNDDPPEEGKEIFYFEPPADDTAETSNPFNVAAAAAPITEEAPEGRTVEDPVSEDGRPPITSLDPTTDHLYRPLRIQFDTSQLAQQMDIALSANDAKAATKLYLLIYEILPMTAQVWGDILRVIPVTGGIYPLAARGSSVDQLLPNGQNNENDAAAGGGEGDEVWKDPVKSMYCPDETTSGIEGGADLLVYATVNRHCPGGGTGGSTTNTRTSSNGGGGAGARKKNVESMGTLASALSCQRDQYDRPITGSIDFCLEGMRGTQNIDVAQLLRQREKQGGKNGHMVGGDGSGGTGTTEKWDGWNNGGGGMNDGSTAAARNENTNGQQIFGGADTTIGRSNRDMIQYSVGVAVHEIGHVLGITSDSLAYFRHPITGHPLTRRPFEVATVTCVNGETTPFVGMPGPAVMQEGRHEGTGNRYFEIVTPTVQKVVRNHFNCQKMTGARLENQPTSTDCFGSHFDEMLYYTEIMGAVFSQSVNLLSPLSLALLEDSGWYRANYQSEYVQISMFGHGAGCDFVENNCIDSKGNVPDVFKEHFCNTPITISSNGLIDTQRSGKQTCDPSHTQKTYCDLVNTNEVVAIGKTGTVLEPAPLEFQYFQPNFRPYIFTNADYCPVPHLDPQSCTEHNGRSPILSEQLEAGERYGPESKCIETDGTRSYSLCLPTRCNMRLGKVQITAGDNQRLTCQYDGQVHSILFNYDSGKELRIKCPKAALVCPQLFCPANCAGRGECVYASGQKNDVDIRAKCVCGSDEDKTAGCYNTNLTFPAVYGYAYENPNRANKTMFMVIVGSLVAGLAVMYVAVRQWKARQNVFM